MGEDEDIKGKVIQIMDKAKPKKKTSRKPSKRLAPLVSINVKGNGNVQVAGDVFITTKQPEKKILPPPDSIGADTLLRNRIMSLFNKIGEAREKRYGKSAYTVLYSKFKRDFGIKNNRWTIIWTWPKECAPDIINYLEEKYANTIQGKIERAASREGYIHTGPQLYKREVELLKHFGMSMKSPEFRELLKTSFGATSHAQLSYLEHWQLVCYLEGVVKKMEES